MVALLEGVAARAPGHGASVALDEDPFLRALTLTCTALLRRLDGDDVPAQRALSEAYAAVQHMSSGPGQAWLLAAVSWIAARD
ncbi:hypothetical protein AB0J72_27430 [Dactylosporangium sp. NPDC049742]|uniref:hypothetical protein n=1 Tax=Dactylosporangium sp. NPDC049742 TaxID=3154737 RepID=UPI0034375FCC